MFFDLNRDLYPGFKKEQKRMEGLRQGCGMRTLKREMVCVLSTSGALGVSDKGLLTSSFVIEFAHKYEADWLPLEEIT